jgi:hypothetical protein
MKDEELQSSDMPAKPVDTSTPNRLEFEVNGRKMWLDWDLYQAQQKFMEKKEAEMWENMAKFQKELYGDSKCHCQDESNSDGE